MTARHYICCMTASKHATGVHAHGPHQADLLEQICEENAQSLLVEAMALLNDEGAVKAPWNAQQQVFGAV